MCFQVFGNSDNSSKFYWFQQNLSWWNNFKISSINICFFDLVCVFIVFDLIWFVVIGSLIPTGVCIFMPVTVSQNLMALMIEAL